MPLGVNFSFHFIFEVSELDPFASKGKIGCPHVQFMAPAYSDFQNLFNPLLITFNSKGAKSKSRLLKVSDLP